MTDRLLIANVSIARTDAKDSRYDLLCDGAMLIDGDRIGWVGCTKDVDPPSSTTNNSFSPFLRLPFVKITPGLHVSRFTYFFRCRY